MKDVRRMADAELALISADPDHPQYDDALEEEDYRAACARDSRVAQAMGESRS